MSEQYQDGTFGDVKPLPDKLKELIDMLPERQSKVVNVHCGTQEEIADATLKALLEIAKAKGVKEQP